MIRPNECRRSRNPSRFEHSGVFTTGPTGHVCARVRAVTSISICMRGSASPAEIIIAAGRIFSGCGEASLSRGRYANIAAANTVNRRSKQRGASS
jgi:hypothetical protein